MGIWGDSNWMGDSRRGVEYIKNHGLVDGDRVGSFPIPRIDDFRHHKKTEEGSLPEK